MLRQRARWLARPWFFAAVALLALNDHLLKSAWPGLVTGKLSDVAGVVVVGTVASVLLGRSWGLALAALGFAALKTVPGVAELAAPVMGGGVTLRDPSDLVALLALPPLWLVLGRPLGERPAGERPTRNRLGLQLVGLAAAVLASTATSQAGPPQDRVVAVGYLDGMVHAKVFLAETEDTLWMRSADRGLTWQLTDVVGQLPQATVVTTTVTASGSPREYIEEQCAEGGDCWRTRSFLSSSTGQWHYLVERNESGAVWFKDLDLPDRAERFAVDPGDGSQVLVSADRRTFMRGKSGAWLEVDLLAVAAELD